LFSYRAEIINYYATLTKEAALREERAMWKIRRSVLDEARRDFLSEDEKAWKEEFEANPEVKHCLVNPKLKSEISFIST
jgi:gamma-tubulin complex component 6